MIAFLRKGCVNKTGSMTTSIGMLTRKAKNIIGSDPRELKREKKESMELRGGRG